MIEKITLITPDDYHLHVRDGNMLSTTVAHAARRIERAIIMPNLDPPITSISQALAYRQRIIEHIPAGEHFAPLMTLYLTKETTPKLIDEAKKAGIMAIKYYPRHGTTNAQWGVSNLASMHDTLAAMSDLDMPLLCHGELSQGHIDIFDREQAFIEQVLTPLQQELPALKVVLEHITTAYAVDYIMQTPDTTAATITAHHLWLNRNDLLGDGIKPHYYCMPILKRKHDQQALILAATSGHPSFFMGTDSAPHDEKNKLHACGCAGIYTGHASIELYAEIFDRHNALDRLESFCSRYGAAFYNLDLTQSTIQLMRKPWQVPSVYAYEGDKQFIPFMANQTLQWKIAASEQTDSKGD